MGAFRRLLDDLELKELKLQGRKFTWSNNRTQTRIDRAFCTAEWDLMLPDCTLQAVSSLVSDHCPLLLVGNTSIKRFRGFRFESFWPKLPGFLEVMQQAWNRSLSVTNPYLRLQTKLQRTAAALRSWAQSKIGNCRLLLAAAKQLIWIFDVVQEYRMLSQDELHFYTQLK